MAQIYISLGSNKNRHFHIQAAVSALSQYFGPLTLSSVYESEAVGFAGDPFYNMVAAANTDLAIADCVTLFKQIEDSYGRDRTAAKFSGRTLDLDLLTYDDVICQQPVELPRAEITENAFVLWPLAEIAPEVVHPLTGQTYSSLWQQYNKQQKLWPVPFNWE
ncbi:2-amino-4-hydroxy-6-hydroxymethyldihydropteridine diphosphokinase [Rheinheimera baltica]|uniref:2-amino-4-hydroxy-6-hydroxymethyldihydropteridine diphosphokinase n=1 Tax=Rheinheimera baltica TaxID=67576 RepID=A0ABT9I362_9GAMM|nr:2-amino-4-hydroxy-6-hydroxymethyldihydropteridine diphosphokinase [Rheinheimera baltica]MDP5137822.1 2-amino-4-hydroxy-6-hydroxymethyldihydropteridine diphosphokinase [Rheinheimera baltica]MDP5142171.1 2-amino-4-hydroxy-6-hydroxymethyldihydropteridine diphosphokinase [Rheinheimera baltica]MDP5150463.1 2-amino-4-hydroxy-6-hydroxymethyldihydropteridine diphosphokinase [Rheinheimera baltica]MDP5190695.1 2-amino-4-hydroxy-6-hydroxymethyldihydropteridine diphosphokinase [Rheinheimera baltica]